MTTGTIWREDPDPGRVLDSLEVCMSKVIGIGVEFCGDRSFDELTDALQYTDECRTKGRFDEGQTKRHDMLLSTLEQAFGNQIDELQWSLTHTHFLRLQSDDEHDTVEFSQLQMIQQRLKRTVGFLNEAKAGQLVQACDEYLAHHTTRALAAAAVVEFWVEYDKLRAWLEFACGSDQRLAPEYHKEMVSYFLEDKASNSYQRARAVRPILEAECDFSFRDEIEGPFLHLLELFGSYLR